jgi:hypothetical protein
MRLLLLVKQTYASLAITTAHPAQLGKRHLGHNQTTVGQCWKRKLHVCLPFPHDAVLGSNGHQSITS